MDWINHENNYISKSDIESFVISDNGDLASIRTRSGNSFEITGSENVRRFLDEIGLDRHRTTKLGKLEKAVLNR